MFISTDDVEHVLFKFVSAYGVIINYDTLRKFIGMKVIAVQNWIHTNTHACKTINLKLLFTMVSE
jgi:hypothetical protein